MTDPHARGHSSRAALPQDAAAVAGTPDALLHYDRADIENMVELRDVHLSFGEKEILKGVSFLVERGESLVVMGASGVGKSTVLRLVLGILRPDAGSVVVTGTDMDLASKTELDAVREKIGMVFQAGALFDSMNVGENVGFRLYEKGALSEEEIVEEVQEKLSFVDLRPEVAGQMPAELSGGMRKRVALARAMVGDPDIILYDEPTTGLDPITAETIDRLIVKLRQARDAVSIVVTHDLDSAFSIGTRFGMLHEGHIIFDGNKEEFIASPDPYIQEFIHLRKSTL
jgi:phospholipid/cholesterol/gamma-HCH transport system ATP-binding protein